MAKLDWEAIETAYRAGVMSLREIASQHGISEGAIRKRAKRDDWSRDLNAKIQQKADDLVRKREVRRTVRNESTLTERVLIEATAEVIATVRMEHRGDIRRARELTNTLFDELAGECGNVAALEDLGEMMRSPDDKGMDKLNDLYHKIISLPSRVKSMKDLSDSLKTLIGLEREAYSIENKAETKEVTHNVMLVPTSDNVDDAATKKLVQNSERRLALAKLEGEARARLQAQYDAADAGVTDPKRIKALQDEYAETYRVTEARKESDKAGKQSASTAESIAQKLENLRQQSELAADSTQELSRDQAILRAQQSLGKSATQAQIQKAGKYAAAAWDAAAAAKGVTEALNAIPEQAENKSYAESMQNLKAALNAGKIDLQEYNAATEQMEQQHQANLAKIRSQQVVNPTQQALAEVDPVQQLANQHAQELALIQQFEQQGVLAHENALALKNAADRQYEQQRIAAQWEILSQQSLGYNMLTSAVDAFSGNASNAITGLLTGTMSAQEAMRSLGNTILNSVINSIVQVGVEALKNYILGQTLGAASVATSVGLAATTASAWAPAAAMASLASFGANAGPAAAGISSTVGLASGLALAGARYNGGPVSAGGLYQVGEKGKPEIYQASTGKQYMIPGDNGKVISNKDMQSGGGISVQVNVINQSTGATVQSADGYMQDGSAVVDLLITDMERGGPVSSQMQQTFGLSRKAQATY